MRQGGSVLELNKNKYAKKEVLDILNAYKNEYEKRIAEQREIIYRLNEEIKGLNAISQSLKDKEQLILSTLVRAEKTAIDLQEQAEQQYALEIERLKKFTARWNNYFRELKEKYPMYSPTKKAMQLKKCVEEIPQSSKAKDAILQIENILPEKAEKFDPKSKIRDYIAATGDNGFNLDEVLNPGELQLEDLCKELGLIDGNE